MTSGAVIILRVVTPPTAILAFTNLAHPVNPINPTTLILAAAQ